MIVNIIEDLKSDLGKFKKTYVSHVFREANPVFDWFANDAITKDLLMMWRNGDEFLAAVTELLQLDQIQGTNIIPI